MVRYEKIPSNNAETTLNGGITDSATSIVVTSGSVFPSTGDYRVVCDSEIMLVTARTTNTLTVVRGVEGTTAVAHLNGADIGMLVTKGGFEKYVTDWIDPWAFDRPPNRLLSIAGATLTSSDFTQNNVGTGTVSDAADGSLVLAAQARTAPNIRVMTRTAPSTPYTITAHLLTNTVEDDVDDGEHLLGFRESGTSKLSYISFSYTNQYEVKYLADWNDATGAPSDAGTILHRRSDYWFRIGYDGADLTYESSINGVDWFQFYTETDTAWFSTAPDQVFWGAASEDTDGQLFTLMAWIEA